MEAPRPVYQNSLKNPYYLKKIIKSQFFQATETPLKLSPLHSGYIFNLYRYYRKISNTSRTKSQTLNVSRLVLQLSLPNPMKPGVKLRMKM